MAAHCTFRFSPQLDFILRQELPTFHHRFLLGLSFKGSVQANAGRSTRHRLWQPEIIIARRVLTQGQVGKNG